LEPHSITCAPDALAGLRNGCALANHASTFNMPSSDYISGGGALKLKGAGVDKKKKKKKAKPTQSTAEASSATDVTKGPAEADASRSPTHTPGRSLSPEAAERSLKEAGGRKKTEAEKRHDEYRRKRLEEKLKREGVKTHKEKVEELNKYLSGLSEHHDMPKIGPG
jgi:protein FAM32A